MTCYLNSLLQALYMTPEFRNALYKWEYKSLDKDSEAKSIPYQLQNLFLNLQVLEFSLENLFLIFSKYFKHYFNHCIFQIDFK